MTKRDDKGRFVKGHIGYKNTGRKGETWEERMGEEQASKLKEFHSNRMIGNKNSFYGKHHSEETKEKIRLKKLGTKHSKEWKEHMSQVMTGTKKTEKDKKGCRERMLEMIKNGTVKNLKGEEHWNWRGGVTPFNKKLRTHSKWKIWRELVFLRDNFTCQNPKCAYCQNKIGSILHPHHIKPVALYPELVFDVNNGITYCKEFHLNSKELHKGIIHLNISVRRYIT